MRISKLKIFGFKSFAQRTEITFPGNGLTAVVGPNGCGKSNIVDAIRWVLGEQRAGVLRMGKMQDVIFSGTEERAAMSMAEVSLVINNDSGELASEFGKYSEVMVTRRAYRNGTSEYLLNNQECRLKDIQNLFLDSGLGSGTYSQMNERMINAVLSDKAEDRRTLFEEAAGVSKYKKSRKEAVNSLARVEEKMERVEDNLRHTRSRVRQYEKQAEKTKEWQELRTQLKSLELSFSIDKFEDFKRDIATLETSHRRIQHELEKEQNNLTLLQAKIDNRRLEISEEENALQDSRRKVDAETNVLNALMSEAQSLRDKMGFLTESVAKISQEKQDAEQKVAEIRKNISELEERIERIAACGDMAEKEEMLSREQEAYQVLRDACDDLRHEHTELVNARFEQQKLVNEFKNRWQRLDAMTDFENSNIETWNKELNSLREVLENAENNLNDAESRIVEIEKEIDETEERLAMQESLLSDSKEKSESLSKDVETLRRENVALESRLDVLSRMAVSEADGSKWLLENKREKLSGCLGEWIEVEPKYLPQIEFALGETLDALVVSEISSVEELLDALENASAGSALFAIASRNQNAEMVEKPVGVLGCASEFVSAKDSLGVLVKRLLSKWMLVNSFEEAISFSERYASSDLWFVSPEIRAVHSSGLVRGGKTSAMGILSRRAEITETQEKQNLLLTEIRVKETELEKAKELLEESERLYSSLKEDLLNLQDTKRTAEAAKNVHTNSKNSLQQQISKKEFDIQVSKDKIAQALNERSSDEQLMNAEKELERIQEAFERVTENLEERQTMLRNKEEDLKELQKDLSDSQLELKNMQSRLQSNIEQLSAFENIVETKKQDIENNSNEIQELEEKTNVLAEKIEAKHNELKGLESVRDEAEERYNVVARDIEDWRSEEREINEKIKNLFPEENNISLRKNAVTDNSKHLRERIFSEWEVDLENAENVERIEYDASVVEREIRQLRGKIKDLGPVNQNVMDDFEEERLRLQEVEKQFDDLDQARASLKRSINKLDSIARERFMDTFHKIQKNFQEVFSRLMKDGGTKLTLQEDVDPLEAEIEVNARPTGKKMRGVKALSGGERALTAVSLLFAIYMEKPSPYCVLDEVDGPLDDANIGRFVELLRHFSRQTQFILVTHNKRTMAASDMLYGVTQEIKGISRIASVKLEDVSL
ncbi:MAG: chromosome segregation protein SMC [Fibrobacteraceae bacterium]|nr:chromosome segregation protein SMC [Fibrobacteraceae bacterium]